MTSMLSIDASTAKRSCATAYLEPNLDRPNLLVLTAAHVTKVRVVVFEADESTQEDM